jgi:TolB-like protein
MTSFFEELKRRKVLRTGALYLAAAWLLLQVAELVFDAFGAPAVTMQLVIGAVAVGFPVVLLLSWVYESTTSGLARDPGEGAPARSPRSSRAVNAAIVILAILAAGIFVHSQFRSAQAPEAGPQRLPAAPNSEPTIAVLPLKNISPDPADAWFADGLTEELLNVLASVPQLQVTARASSFALRDEGLDAVALGERLGVGHILDGSVRRQGSTVRVSVRLVRTSNGTPLWSVAYDRELTDIFEIQEDIAERVSGTLQLSLLGDPNPIVRRTAPEAYSAYLRALFTYRQRTPEAYGQVVKDVQAALAIDDEYAPA